MIGTTELIVIMVIVFLIFGAKRLPELGGALGKAIKDFKKSLNKPDEIDITPPRNEKEEDKKDD